MTEHAERFTGRMEAYEQYRLRYPAEVAEMLRDRCGLTTEYQVADIGAGTGMVAEIEAESSPALKAAEEQTLGPQAEVTGAGDDGR